MYHNGIPADEDIFEMISMVKLLECEVCGIKLPNIERLENHMNRAHRMKIEDVKQVAGVVANVEDREFDGNQNECGFENQNKQCDGMTSTNQHNLFANAKDNETLVGRNNVLAKDDRNMNDNVTPGDQRVPKVKFDLFVYFLCSNKNFHEIFLMST